MKTFDTGRTYDKPQVIEYTVVATESTDHWLMGSEDVTVEFHDTARGIKGRVWLPMVTNETDLQRSLMASYDAGTYTSI